MARHFRRLTLWLLAGIATLALLALCALAALWWFIDPDDYKGQIETRASSAIGRPVHLTGRLRWQLGTQVYIVSEGGDVANAAGFAAQPLARWTRLRLGVALRPLLHKRVLIDLIDIDGPQLLLQKNAQGSTNWQLQLADGGEEPASPVALRIGAVKLSNGEVRYQDAGSGADWHLSELALRARLPEDLAADERQFRAIEVAGLVAGGPLAAGGVRFSLRTDSIRVSSQQLQMPAYELQWADADVRGGIAAALGAEPNVTATLAMQAPSLRTLLATVGVTPLPMTDPTTLGKLQFSAKLQYAAGAATLDALAIALDDTHLTGVISLPHIDPLALRFDLNADRANLDRYLEPADANSQPFELPLAQLKALDAKGVLRIQQATVAGAAAKEVRIDVE